MAGHSHWSTIKHKKARQDAKRGKSFSKLAKAIIIAAKHGGGDPDMNLKLRYAIDKAKSGGMPKDNIERAVKRGSGETTGEDLDELVYEAFGPGGVAIVIESITDNRNRTTPEVKKILEMRGGNLAAQGATTHLFEKKGVIAVAKDAIGEEELMEIVLEAGADDVETSDDGFQVTTTPSAFDEVCKALEAKKLSLEVAEVMSVPLASVTLEKEKDLDKVREIVALLEEHDDVENVWVNFDDPESDSESEG